MVSSLSKLKVNEYLIIKVLMYTKIDGHITLEFIKGTLFIILIQLVVLTSIFIKQLCERTGKHVKQSKSSCIDRVVDKEKFMEYK